MPRRPSILRLLLPLALVAACSSEPAPPETPGASFTMTDQDGRVVGYSWDTASWENGTVPGSAYLAVNAEGMPPTSAGSLSITQLSVGMTGERFQSVPADLELPIGAGASDTASVAIMKLGGGAFALSGTVRIRRLANAQVRTDIAANFGTYTLDGTIIADEN